MYVRNYGTQPKNASKNDEPVDFDQIRFSDEIPKEEQSDERSTERKTTSVQDESAETVSELPAQSTFGANGVPRQPLRRRKRPQRDAEHGNSPQNDDKTVFSDAEKSEPIAPFIPVCETSPTCQETKENKIPSPCAPPLAERHREHSEARNPLGCFTGEDLFLGGLILLLINDRASDDILLILAFLLVSGIHFNA